METKSLLKVDEKICQKYKPGVEVINATYGKYNDLRFIWFEDNTSIAIETNNGNSYFFDRYMKQLYQDMNFSGVIVITQRIKDNNKQITFFELKEK